MEPVTHALASLALGRAGVSKVTRLATPMLLISGLAADLDWLSVLSGARVFLHDHRAVTHSLAGSGAIALAAAAAFWALGRKHPSAPVQFARALLVCGAGAAGHLLLDLGNSYGVMLLWPFRAKWYAWDLLAPIDPWVLILLLLGLLLPSLFRLVSEEIGARPKAHGAQRGAIVALVLLAGYVGGRWMLHDRALEVLNSRVYHGQTPLAVGAFPAAGSPFAWSGIVETESAVEEVPVPLGPGSAFDPDLARTYFKPEASPTLEAARNSALAREFLQFARFPKASVEKTPDGYRVELRDLRLAAGSSRGGILAVIELNPQTQVIHEELRFRTDRKR